MTNVIVTIESDKGQLNVPAESIIFSSDFLITCDSISAVVGANKLAKDIVDVFNSGKLSGKKFSIDLQVNNDFRTIFIGYIDFLNIIENRAGTFYNLQGRNVLGPLSDAQIDPYSDKYKFKEGQTLQDVMDLLFGEFGVTAIFHTDAKNRQIVSGNDKSKLKSVSKTTTESTGATNIGTTNQSSGTKQVTTTTVTDSTNTFKLDDKSIKKIQPKHGESYMQFIDKNLKRFGLNCWGSLDDSTGKFSVVIGQPDYDTSKNPIINLPPYTDRNITYKLSGHPRMIIAKGHQGGGKHPTNRTTVIKINEFLDNSDVATLISNVKKRFPGAVINDQDDRLKTYSKYFQSSSNFPREIYLEDGSTNRPIQQLQRFVDRKMSEYQSQAIEIKYTLPGFTYKDEQGQEHIWKINTMVKVFNNNPNDTAGFSGEVFWVKSCNFNISRNGSTTVLHLIPAYTINFGPTDE